jgi:hypothetical protein
MAGRGFRLFDLSEDSGHPMNPPFLEVWGLFRRWNTAAGFISIDDNRIQD